MTDHPTSSSGVRRLRERARRLRRAVLARRRFLAALLAAAAVAAGLQAMAAPPPATAPVLVAQHDLVAGTVLATDDLEVRRWPAEAVPGGPDTAAALPRLDEAVGRVLAAPLTAGEPVTDVRLGSAGFATLEPGLAAVPIRLPDAGVVELLAPGDRVDLVATDPADATAETLAEDVLVLAVPRPDGDATGALSGAPGGGGGAVGGPGGRLVVVAVSENTTTQVSAAAVSSYLSVTFSR